MNILLKEFKGIYSIKSPYDLKTHEFPRKLNGNYEDIDVYLKCQFHCQIFSYGHGKLQFYCPSLIRGRNIIKQIYRKFINPHNTYVDKSEHESNGKIIIKENIKIKDIAVYRLDMQSDKKIIFNIEETDSEVTFLFKYHDMNKLESILKPSTLAPNRSPFSSKNLPKSDYKIPDDELEAYKEITSNIPRERLITLVHTTSNFIKSIATKGKSQTDMTAEMRGLGMKPKEYIHYIGKWNDYIKYLKERVSKNE